MRVWNPISSWMDMYNHVLSLSSVEPTSSQMEASDSCWTQAGRPGLVGIERWKFQEISPWHLTMTSQKAHELIMLIFLPFSPLKSLAQKKHWSLVMSTVTHSLPIKPFSASNLWPFWFELASPASRHRNFEFNNKIVIFCCASGNCSLFFLASQVAKTDLQCICSFH